MPAGIMVMPRTTNRLGQVAGAALLTILASTAPVSAQGLSGLYYGVDGGAAWSAANQDRKGTDLVWGGHAGYGLQFAMFYLGAEIDGTWGGSHSTIQASSLYSSTLDVDWKATARARAGVTLGNLLVYATGGGAWSGQTVGIHAPGGGGTTDTKTVSGAVLGGGLEFMPVPFVSARIEALRYDFSADAANVVKSLPSGFSAGSLKGFKGDETVVRAGISLHLH